MKKDYADQNAFITEVARDEYLISLREHELHTAIRSLQALVGKEKTMEIVKAALLF